MPRPSEVIHDGTRRAVADPEDRVLVEADLAVEPWFGLG